MRATVGRPALEVLLLTGTLCVLARCLSNVLWLRLSARKGDTRCRATQVSILVVPARDEERAIVWKGRVAP